MKTQRAGVPVLALPLALLAFAVAMGLAPLSPALAQQQPPPPPLAQQPPPNLVGTWKGVSPGGAVMGASPYHQGAQRAEPYFTEPLEFTITISEQKANRFTGKLTDGKRTENFIGAISPNNLVGVMLDDDGQYVFTIRDIETLDVCYSHATPGSKVVACYPWTKSK
jgi:hypothetical protein